MSVDLRSVRGRLDLPLRLLFHGYLREEVWALRRRGTRVVTIEPDAAVLSAMGLNMMDGRNRRGIERPRTHGAAPAARRVHVAAERVAVNGSAHASARASRRRR
jgi:hypothetical protein